MYKLFRQLVVALLLCGSSVGIAAHPSPEEEFLREAARGHLQNVFLLRIFKGYVAFPRTAIVEQTSGPGAVTIEVAVDGDARGWALVGSYALTKDGRKVDVVHSRTLPARPRRVEARGRLTIEYFGTAEVLVHDSSDYVLLTGVATALTEEFVETSVALSGPPDIFSKAWRSDSVVGGAHPRSGIPEKTNKLK